MTPLEIIQGVLDLMEAAGRPPDEQAPDTILPYGNGYATWFIPNTAELPTTKPLTAREILGRVVARRVALENYVG